MKTIKTLLLLLLISSPLFAQKQVYPTQSVDTYVGTWIYQSNDTVFKIVLQKGHSESMNMVMPGLFGGYFLSVKGNVLENYMQPLPTVWIHRSNPSNLYIFANNYGTQGEEHVNFKFFDQRKRHFNGSGISGGRIYLLSPTKIHWQLDEKLGLKIEANMDEKYAGAKPIGFSVPTDVIMVKEK